MAGQTVDLGVSLWAALFIGSGIVGAATLSYLYDENATLPARLAMGVVVGQTALGFVGYALASVFGLNPVTLIITAFMGLLPLPLVFRVPLHRARLLRDVRRMVACTLRFRQKSRWTFRAATLLLFALLVILFRGAMFEKNGAIYTTNHNNLGDLPFHLAVVQNFAVGENFPPAHPEFAHVPLTYPFLVDFIAAQWVRCGLSLSAAFFAQNLLLAAALIVLMYRWVLTWTRSRTAALLVPWLIFFSGGWGFTLLWDDYQHTSGSFWDLLSHLPHDYTINAGDYKWGNALTTLFTTQRGLLLGFPLALLVWTLWWQVQHDAPSPARTRRLIGAGVITGLLPLVHGHTFLCLIMVGGALTARDVLVRGTDGLGVRDWLLFFAPALVLAVPQALLLSAHSAARPGAFFGWQPGWEAGSENWLRFWLRITGPFIPLLGVGLLGPLTPNNGGTRGAAINGRLAALGDAFRVPPLLGVRGPLARFTLPFLLCFLVPNLVRLAPWSWDNIKVLFYWHAAFAPLVALVLARMAQGGKAARAGAALLFVLLTLSGGLDVWRVASGNQTYPEFDADGIAFARAIQNATPPNAVLLHAPTFNHPALLSGRRLLLGYRGHLWSHGLEFEPRWADVKRIYAAADAPTTDALLRQYHVWGVVVGPPERSGGEEIRANEAFLSQHYPVAVQEGAWRLYRIAPVLPLLGNKNY